MNGFAKIRGSIGLFIGILLIPVFAQIAAAQETNQTAQKKSEDFQRKKWSLQFKIGDNFTLSSFQGALISCQRQVSDRSAIRLGVGINLSDDHRDYDRNEFDTNSYNRDSEENIDSDSKYINTSLLYTRYAHPESNLTAFYGFGPNLEFEWYNAEDEHIGYDVSGNVTSKSKQKIDIDNIDIGIIGALGFEWFLSKSISLTAEYGLLLKYYWDKRKSRTENVFSSYGTETEFKSNGFAIDATSVKFGLSAYF
jgi:hypothetical protein